MFSTSAPVQSEEPIRTQTQLWRLLGNLASAFSYPIPTSTRKSVEEGDSPKDGSSQATSISQPEDTAITRQAEHPFNASSFTNDTIIIQSSDNIFFFALKTILSMSSPFLSDLFSKENEENATCDVKQGQGSVPKVSLGRSSNRDFVVLAVPVDSETLDIVLRVIYPIPIPDTLKFAPFIPEVLDHTSLDLASRVLDCAHTLKIQRVTDIVADQLLEFCRSLCRKFDVSGCNTLRIDGPNDQSTASAIALHLYALGCRHRLPCLISAGMRASLHFPPYDAHSHLPAIDHISGTQLYHLQAFRRDAVTRVTSLLRLHATYKNPEPLDLANIELNDAVTCYCCHKLEQTGPVPASQWWHAFITSAVPMLAAAPMSQEIYEQEFFMPFWRVALGCESCARKDSKDWSRIVQLLRQEITKAAWV